MFRSCQVFRSRSVCLVSVLVESWVVDNLGCVRSGLCFVWFGLCSLCSVWDVFGLGCRDVLDLG